MAAQVVNFLILLFILKKFLYKPLLKVLDERKQKIADSLKNAEEIEKKLSETEEEKEKVLAKTASDIQKMMNEAKKEIEIMKDEGKVQAEQLVAQIIKKGEETARAETDRMRKEVMAQLTEIIGTGMEKVAQGAFDKKKQREIIEIQVRNLS